MGFAPTLYMSQSFPKAMLILKSWWEHGPLGHVALGEECCRTWGGLAGVRKLSMNTNSLLTSTLARPLLSSSAGCRITPQEGNIKENTAENVFIRLLKESLSHRPRGIKQWKGFNRLGPACPSLCHC